MLKAGPERINRLKNLESFSILASVGGTVAALISQQTALAILPFSFSLSLGWWNRRDQQMQIRSQKMVIERLKTDLDCKYTEIDKFLSASSPNWEDQLQTLSQEFQQRTEPQQIAQAQQALQTLNQKLTQVEQTQNDQRFGLNTLKNSTDEINSRLSQFGEREYQWLEQQFNQLNLYLKSIDHKYELVCDRKGSREKLLEAINMAEERLILVCPWPAYGLSSENNEVYTKLRSFLEDHPKAVLDIGWGHRKDINKLEQKPSLESLLNYSNFYDGADLLRKLEISFPDRCRLKILGTHEKFIVCDHHFGIIGSHNFFTSGPGNDNSDRELGIYTTNPSIIYQMIRRFEQAPDLGG